MQTPDVLQEEITASPDSDEVNDPHGSYIVKYRRTSLKSPFQDQQKSGSFWAKDELDWLQVEIHHGLSLSSLLESSSDTLDEVESLSLLSQWMDVEWADVKNGDFDLDLSVFYAYLRDLGQEPVDIYAISSSSPYVTQTPRRAPTHDIDDGNNTSTASSTPGLQPQQNDEPTPAPQIPSSPPLRKSEQSSPILPPVLTPRVANDTRILPADSSVYDSDSTYNPSTPNLPLSDPTSSSYDKPEPDVVATVRGFLQLLKRSNNKLTQARLYVQTPLQLKVVVDGSTVSTTPDLTFRYTSSKGRLLYCLNTECKRKKHNLTVHEIWGQEVCHLLAQAQQYFNVYPRWTSCKVYLLHWHHLAARVSRAEVRASYLGQLATNSKDIPESLQIETCNMLNMKEPAERIELAQTLYRIFRQEAGASLQQTGL